jgi:hypothetical protein
MAFPDHIEPTAAIAQPAPMVTDEREGQASTPADEAMR